MYDTISFSKDFNLPSELKFLKDYNFQTKSLELCLIYYEINKKGKLESENYGDYGEKKRKKKVLYEKLGEYSEIEMWDFLENMKNKNYNYIKNKNLTHLWHFKLIFKNNILYSIAPLDSKNDSFNKEYVIKYNKCKTVNYKFLND